MMGIKIEPTEEMYEAPLNGVNVPCRIWAGFTDGGIPIEAYVLSITPLRQEDADKLGAELNMKRSRDVFKIDLG